MPKPVPITYTDNNGITKQVEDFEQIQNDPHTSAVVATMAPGVGTVNFMKKMDVYFKFTREKQLEIMNDFEKIIEELFTIVQADNSTIDYPAIENLFALQSQEIKDYFWQLLFFCRLDNQIKKTLFAICSPIFTLDMHVVLCLVGCYPQFLSTAFEIFGTAFGNQKILNCPCVFSFVNGVLTEDKLANLDLFIKYGCDLNIQDTNYGTLLHNFLANELSQEALKLIDKLIQAKSIPVYNFTACDGSGKTPLLIAAKTRQHKVVAELCKIYKNKNIDIGIDVPDPYGRTPIMLAAALGDLPSFMALQQAGANLAAQDLAANDLNFYLNAEPQLIEEILESIHIKAQRDYKARHNWLYFNDQLCRPVTHDNSMEEHKRVLISFAPENIELLRATVMEAFESKNKKLYEFYINQLAPIGAEIAPNREKFKDYLHNKIALPPRKTFLDICLEGQSLVKQFHERILKKTTLRAH